MIELDIHTRMVDAARDAGGYALKMNNRFVKGVPDLMIKMPTLPVVFIEVKFMDKEPLQGWTINDGLTELQRREIHKIQNAGGYAGLAYVVRGAAGVFKIVTRCDVSKKLPISFSSTRPLGDQFPDGDEWYLRVAGKAWPIYQICEYFIQDMKGA